MFLYYYGVDPQVSMAMFGLIILTYSSILYTVLFEQNLYNYAIEHGFCTASLCNAKKYKTVD